ncbi:MAG: PKD domain-containing protein, partial [Thermoplasmata archaeon]
MMNRIKRVSLSNPGLVFLSLFSLIAILFQSYCFIEKENLRENLSSNEKDGKGFNNYHEDTECRAEESGINITIFKPRFSLPAILAWNDTLEIELRINFTEYYKNNKYNNCIDISELEKRVKQSKAWIVNLFNDERNVSLVVADVFILNKNLVNVINENNISVECKLECPVFRTYFGNYELYVGFMSGYGLAERAVSIIEDAQNFTFVQITDTHIQNRTSENENRLLNLSNELNLISPTFGILTGDTCDNLLYVSEGEIEKAYIRLKKVLLSFNFPIFVVSGNHDNFHGAISIYKRIINPFADYSFTIGSVHFIGLDSGGPTGPYGDTLIGLEGKGLTDEQIAWLVADLDKNKNASEKIIFMHHPAIADEPSASTAYQEQTISQNREEFINLCVEKKVSLVLSGHTHEDNSYTADERKESGNASFSYPLFIQTRSACASNSENGNGYRLVEIRNGKIVSYSYDGDGNGARDASSAYPTNNIFYNSSRTERELNEIPCYGWINVSSDLNVDVNCSFKFYLSSDYVYNLSRGWVYDISKIEGVQAQYVHVKFGLNKKERTNVTISAYTGSIENEKLDVTIYDYDVSLIPSSGEINGILVAGERATLHAMIHSISLHNGNNGDNISSRLRADVHILSRGSKQVEEQGYKGYQGLENIGLQSYIMVYNFSGAQYINLEFRVPHVGSVYIEVMLLDINETCRANNRVHKTFISNLRPRAISSVQNGSVYRTYEGIKFDAKLSYDRDFDNLTSCIWDFGDGSYEKKFEVLHSYNKKGRYMVWLEITDEYGANANISFEVVILNSAPVVVLSVMPRNPLTFENILLSGEGSYDVDEEIGNANYYWHLSFYPKNCSDVSDTNSNKNCKIENYYIGKNVSVQFERPGRLEVVLTIRDSENASSSAIRSIEISNRAPECSFYHSYEGQSKPVFSLEDILFVSSANDIDGRIVSYFWTFGDGNSILSYVDEKNHNEKITYEDGICVSRHSYDRPGVYTVELMVYDDLGLCAKYSKELVVLNRKPHACITYKKDGEWVDVNENILILEGKNRIYLSCDKSYDEDGGIMNIRWLGEFLENERYRKVLDANSERITLDLKNEGMYILRLEVFDIYGEIRARAYRSWSYKSQAGFELFIKEFDPV